MPPTKKTKKAAKPKKGKGKTKTKMSQVQKTHVHVRVGAGGGGGGGMSAPIVYATYAPPPPANPTQFIFDNGLPPAPVKAAPVSLSSGGVTVKPKYPVRPQSHQGMSPLDKFFFDAARHRPPTEASLSSYDDLPRRAASKKSEQGADAPQGDASMRDAPQGHASMRDAPLPRRVYEPQGELLRRSERDYVPQEAPGRAASMGAWPPPRAEPPRRAASERPATASMKSEPREESMKSEPREQSMRSEQVYYMPQVPAEPPGTHHQRDSPAERAMTVDSSRVSGHTRARTPPLDGGSVHSSSVKSELPSVKSEQWVRGGSLPGTSVGISRPPSVKTEPPSVKSEHPSIKSEPHSIKSGSKSDGMVGMVMLAPLRGRASLKSEPSSEASSKRPGYYSGHTHISASSRVLSSENNEAGPSSRRDKVLERVGRTFEVKEKRPGYVAETKARRRS
jgi:hypothetical protein